ncbi:TPA: hypothetical protein NIH48_000554 [Pseudomonas aeruginosa]|nr:hypothetical protein [Pseudomonas aeruginosa]EKU4049979.1 hypothetical protein [Pseudomonas aeruginosa]EKX7955251.1 hypothetical protein [Pseudomonas aeruginosa]EKX9336828.1 hypothetical protein [Pseudomonas aeruginosa]HBO5298947.1 hypothetical protein [Pseudomonas aeruginosa]
MTAIFELVKDPYERKARVIPGLLVSLPLLVPILCVYGAKHPVLTSVIGLLGGCGAIYALSSIARGRGKKLEEKLLKKWGGMPTTLALRHRDKFLDCISKQRYHSEITLKLGIEMPSEQDEAQDPEKADGIYIGATKRLRELTRDNRNLLLKENIAYGFHRNMLAMKPVGIFSCICGLGYGGLIAGVIQAKPPYFEPINLANPGLAAGLTILISVSLLMAWLFYFDKDAVKRMGFVYAERLFECLALLPTPRPKKKTTIAQAEP